MNRESTAIDNRNIRVFISSTFNDMQQERDALVSKVFPMLRQRAAKRNVTLTDIDLRWGVTEEESHQSQVVEICLDEINRSRPFFIGLLGSRYGWTPTDETVDWTQVLPAHLQWVADQISKGMSMTEIEIRYGALHSQQPVHGAFYLKTCDPATIDPRQQQLREEIEQQATYPTHSYASVEELCQRVEEDFMQMLDALYPQEDGDSVQSYTSQLENTLRRLTKYYIPQPDSIQQLNTYLADGAARGICITGESGMGKSAFLAHFALRQIEEDRADVIALFATEMGNHATLDGMAETICQQLQQRYGVQYTPDGEAISQLRSMANQVAPNRPLYIIVDGINQLATSDKSDAVVGHWWPKWGDDVRTIFSCPQESNIYQNIPSEWARMELHPLNSDQRIALAQNYFAEYRKSLTQEQLIVLSGKSSVVENTLVYTSLLDEVRRYGHFETLDDYMEQLMHSSSTSAFFETLLKHQQQLFADANNSLAVLLSMLAVAEDGLPEYMLAEASGLSRLTVSQILCLNSMHIALRQGKAVFTHSLFRDAIEKFYLSDKQSVGRARQRIVDYYTAHADTAEAPIELTFQYLQMQDMDSLYLTLLHEKTYQAFDARRRLPTYAYYWYKLHQVNAARYSPVEFVYRMESIAKGLSEGMFEDSYFTSMMADAFSQIDTDRQYRIITKLANTMLIPHRMAVPARQLLYAFLVKIEHEKDEPYATMRSNVLHSLAISYQMQQRWHDAMSIYKQILGSRNMDELDAADAVVCNMGELMLQMYESGKSEKMLDNALALLRANLEARVEKYGELHQEVAMAYANYASAMHYKDSRESIRLQEKSTEIFRRLHGDLDIDVALQYKNMALQLMAKEPSQALEYALKSLDLYERLGGEYEAQVVEANAIVGLIYSRTDDFDSAVEYLSYAHNGMLQNPQLDDDGATRKRLYYVALRAGRLELSMQLVEEMLDLAKNDDERAEAYSLQGNVYMRMQRVGEAEQSYRHAIRIAQQAKKITSEIELRCRLARALWTQGQSDAARNELDEAIRLSEEADLCQTAIFTHALYNRALTMVVDRMEIPQAIADIERAIEIRQTIVNEDDPDLNEYRSQLDKIKQAYGPDGMRAEEADSIDLHEADEMDQMLRHNAKAAILFRQGLSAFRRGSVDPALNYFHQVLSCLPEEGDLSAKAQTYRFIAYASEAALRFEGAKQYTYEDIKEQYEYAIELAHADDNLSLSADIWREMAECFWNKGEYDEAERCYWQSIVDSYYSNSYADIVNARTLHNIVIAIDKQHRENAYSLQASITVVELFLLQFSDQEHDELYETAMNELGYFKHLAGEEENGGEFFYDVEALNVSEYLTEKQFYSVALMYIEQARQYARNNEDQEQEERAVAMRVTILMNLHYYMRALRCVNEYLAENDAIMSPDTRHKYGYVLCMIYIYAHDMKKAYEVAASYGVDESVVQAVQMEVLPCYQTLLNGDSAEAEERYEQLMRAETHRERELYDMTMYCLQRNMPYEAINHFREWKEMVEKFEDDIPLFEEARNATQRRIDSAVGNTTT